MEDFLKFAFFSLVTMAAGLLDISWDPHIFFSVSSTQNNPYIDITLHATFEEVWIVRS